MVTNAKLYTLNYDEARTPGLLLQVIGTYLVCKFL